LLDGGNRDSIVQKFVQGKVADQRDGSASVLVDTQGGGGSNEVQILKFDATDGNFKVKVGDQVSEEMLFIPLDPEKVRASISTALNAFAGIDATVTKIGGAADSCYRIEFNGVSANTNVPTLEVLSSNLTRGERTFKVVGGLPGFITAQGNNILRGATIKIVG